MINSSTVEPERPGAVESVLDPVSRTSEILFGLIMVLSFTCSLSALEAGRSEVRDMLIGALGCNLAWGIIDAFFYLMNVAAERGRERVLIQKLGDITDHGKARELFRSVLPESIVNGLSADSVGELQTYLVKSESLRRGFLLSPVDLRAALLVFWFVFLSTFPVAMPFLVIQEPWRAVRASNFVALLLLFGLGYSLGRHAGGRPLLWGMCMVVIGATLVSVTIALGG